MRLQPKCFNEQNNFIYFIFILSYPLLYQVIFTMSKEGIFFINCKAEASEPITNPPRLKDVPDNPQLQAWINKYNASIAPVSQKVTLAEVQAKAVELDAIIERNKDRRENERKAAEDAKALQFSQDFCKLTQAEQGEYIKIMNQYGGLPAPTMSIEPDEPVHYGAGEWDAVNGCWKGEEAVTNTESSHKVGSWDAIRKKWL